MTNKTLECFYCNDSHCIQVIRLFNSIRGLEKTLNPGQGIFFQAQRGSILEVHDLLLPTSTLAARIDCLILVTECFRLSESFGRWDTLKKQSA